MHVYDMAIEIYLNITCELGGTYRTYKKSICCIIMYSAWINHVSNLCNKIKFQFNTILNKDLKLVFVTAKVS